MLAVTPHWRVSKPVSTENSDQALYSADQNRCPRTVLMLFNLAVFLWVARRYQYKTVARKREAPPHRRPQWLQPQVVDGIVIPVRPSAAVRSAAV